MQHVVFSAGFHSCFFKTGNISTSQKIAVRQIGEFKEVEN